MEETVTDVKEVERTVAYCDECGNECTNSRHKVIRDNCSGCMSNRETAYRSYEKAREDIMGATFAERDLFGQIFTNVLMWPMMIMFSCMEATDGWREEMKVGGRQYLMTSIGASLWTIGVGIAIGVAL